MLTAVGTMPLRLLPDCNLNWPQGSVEKIILSRDGAKKRCEIAAVADSRELSHGIPASTRSLTRWACVNNPSISS